MVATLSQFSTTLANQWAQYVVQNLDLFNGLRFPTSIANLQDVDKVVGDHTGQHAVGNLVVNALTTVVVVYLKHQPSLQVRICQRVRT